MHVDLTAVWVRALVHVDGGNACGLGSGLGVPFTECPQAGNGHFVMAKSVMADLATCDNTARDTAAGIRVNVSDFLAV
jgi:hypothetical protein